MEEGILTVHQDKDSDMIRQVVEEVVSPRGYKDIRANLEEYESPSKLTRRQGDEEEFFIPDITGVINGRKSYFELALKTDEVRQVVTKWKLMANLASFKRGKLYLIVPRGHYAFASRILNTHAIQAEIVKL